MKDSTKKQLLALIGILIVITLVVIYNQLYVEDFTSVNITSLSYQAPSNIIITISGTMPSNITGKTLTLKSFTISSSNVDGDTTPTTGNNVVTAFTSTPMPIAGNDSSTITTNTVPTKIATNNNIIINGTGIVLIKNI
jgi:hypothetical protein